MLTHVLLQFTLDCNTLSGRFQAIAAIHPTPADRRADRLLTSGNSEEVDVVVGQGPEEDESQQQRGVEDLSKKHCKPAGIVGPSVRQLWDQTARTHHLSCSSGVICVKTAQASVSALILQ